MNSFIWILLLKNIELKHIKALIKLIIFEKLSKY